MGWRREWRRSKFTGERFERSDGSLCHHGGNRECTKERESSRAGNHERTDRVCSTVTAGFKKSLRSPACWIDDDSSWIYVNDTTPPPDDFQHFPPNNFSKPGQPTTNNCDSMNAYHTSPDVQIQRSRCPDRMTLASLGRTPP